MYLQAEVVACVLSAVNQMEHAPRLDCIQWLQTSNATVYYQIEPDCWAPFTNIY